MLENTLKTTNILKLEINAIFIKKIAKICDIKKLKTNQRQIKRFVTYYQFHKAVFWPLRLERRQT